MTATALELSPRPGDAFRHEAVLYAGEAGFLDATLPFVRGGLESGEPVLVVVGAPKIDMLRAALGAGADAVRFADMAEVGRNPARIIPAWRDFVDEHASVGRVRGIGEPIFAARGPAELVECQRHESLLNLAFDGAPAWWLLCPYDTTTLGRSVLEEARRSHPYVAEGGSSRESAGWQPDSGPEGHMRDPLPEPARHLGEVPFGPGELVVIRTMVTTLARRFGLNQGRSDDLVLAVNEITTNSLRHGGGKGTFRVWRDGRALVCEVRDSGRIDDPLAGRRAPGLDADGGRGLWLANLLCDLVQIRSLSEGSMVRLHMALDA